MMECEQKLCVQNPYLHQRHVCRGRGKRVRGVSGRASGGNHVIPPCPSVSPRLPTLEEVDESEFDDTSQGFLLYLR